MITVDMRNETASNHLKQTQMGVLGDGSESGKTREINKFYFHMHNSLMGQSHWKSYGQQIPNRRRLLCSCKQKLVGGPDGKG